MFFNSTIFFSIFFALAPTRVIAASGEVDAATCKKYEGHYISYYDEIFKVVKCVRVHIEDHASLFSFQAKGGKIIDVDAQVIKKLPDEVVLTVKLEGKTCHELEGKYITYTLNEVYVVEKCKKRLFKDWESYKSHSKKKSVAQKKIVQLNWTEFTPIVPGPPMPSDTDAYFKNELAQDSFDIIPYDKACRGLEGKVVAYYHELYLISNCKKRLFLEGQLLGKNQKSQILEIDSQRWMSLPYGKPIETEKSKKDIEYEKSQL